MRDMLHPVKAKYPELSTADLWTTGKTTHLMMVVHFIPVGILVLTAMLFSM
jgi:hypothetical protein